MMFSLGPAGFSASKKNGESVVNEIMQQSVRKYEFSIGKEHMDNQGDSAMQTFLAPLKYHAVPMPYLPGLSKSEKEHLNNIYLNHMNRMLGGNNG